MKKYYKISLSIQLAIYLLSVYVKWSFFIPLKWLLNMPSWGEAGRIYFLLMLSVYTGTQIMFYKSIKTDFKDSDYYMPFWFLVLIFFIFLMPFMLENKTP